MRKIMAALAIGTLLVSNVAFASTKPIKKNNKQGVTKSVASTQYSEGIILFSQDPAGW